MLPVKALGCGSRFWADPDGVHRVLHAVFFGLASHEVTIVHGDAPGADTRIDTVAKRAGWNRHPYPVDWRLARQMYGPRWRRAGIDRNGQMLLEHPDIDVALAFHDDPRLGSGTKNMRDRCVAAGIPFIVWSHLGAGVLIPRVENPDLSQLRPHSWLITPRPN